MNIDDDCWRDLCRAAARGDLAGVNETLNLMVMPRYQGRDRVPNDLLWAARFSARRLQLRP